MLALFELRTLHYAATVVAWAIGCLLRYFTGTSRINTSLHPQIANSYAPRTKNFLNSAGEDTRRQEYCYKHPGFIIWGTFGGDWGAAPVPPPWNPCFTSLSRSSSIQPHHQSCCMPPFVFFESTGPVLQTKSSTIHPCIISISTAPHPPVHVRKSIKSASQA